MDKLFSYMLVEVETFMGWIIMMTWHVKHYLS